MAFSWQAFVKWCFLRHPMISSSVGLLHRLIDWPIQRLMGKYFLQDILNVCVYEYQWMYVQFIQVRPWCLQGRAQHSVLDCFLNISLYPWIKKFSRGQWPTFKTVFPWCSLKPRIWIRHIYLASLDILDMQSKTYL